MKLYTKIIIGMIAGVAFGLLAKQFGFGPRAAAWVEPLGKIFIRLITMVVVPLVVASITLGTASLGSLKKLGRIGAKTFAYYMVTTALAITIGLTLANLVKPGAGLDENVKAQLLQDYQATAQEQITKSAGRSKPIDLLLNIVPTNPIKAMAEGEMLGLIFFSLALGIALTYLPVARSQPVLNFLDGVNEAIIQLVHLIMKFAPFGVFGLMAAVVGKFGFDILLTLLKYSLVVLVGLALQMLLVYTFSVRFLGGLHPIHFFKGMRPAHLIAFSTSSSNATLPVNIQCCEENLGLPKEICSFVLPLGATINMDGTALLQGVVAVFIAQVYGISLTFNDQMVIMLTATLASVGAAGVPSAGIVMLAMILQPIGLPLEGIGLILGVDRLLDMCRTVVNITGDATCAAFIARSERVSGLTPSQKEIPKPELVAEG
jgi:Na+/H+-dicarboxylate symporter